LFSAAEPSEEPPASRDESCGLCRLREALKIDNNAGAVCRIDRQADLRPRRRSRDTSYVILLHRVARA
jgi:hypothetical protein